MSRILLLGAKGVAGASPLVAAATVSALGGGPRWPTERGAGRRTPAFSARGELLAGWPAEVARMWEIAGLLESRACCCGCWGVPSGLGWRVSLKGYILRKGRQRAILGAGAETDG